ncbi:MAG: hypothetical protein ACRDH9_10475 [Actinomycetota bacterium]
MSTQVATGQQTLEGVEAGEALRDQGMRLVELNVDQDWSSRFDAEVRRRARTGELFTVDDVIEAVGEPDKPNAKGARINAAARGGLIVQVDWVKSPRASRHANPNRIWKGTAKAMQLPQEPSEGDSR